MKKNNNLPKHFINLSEINDSDLKNIIKYAKKLKKNSKLFSHSKKLDQANLMMIFEKTSTRTRVSFGSCHQSARRQRHCDE